MGNRLAVFGTNLARDFDRFDRLTLAFMLNVNDLRTRAEVLQWYLDLNAGGTPHTDAELKRVRRLLDESR